MKIRITKNKTIWEFIVLLVLDGLFFGLTNPNKINSVFLVIGFVLFGLSLYLFVQIFLTFLHKLGFKVKNRGKLAGFVAILASILLAMQSIGQLSDRDVLIIIPLAILLYIYVAYIQPRTLI